MTKGQQITIWLYGFFTGVMFWVILMSMYKCEEHGGFGFKGDCIHCKKPDDSGEVLSVVRPEYKPVTELQPHCPNCKERLTGNNSIALPYQCSCGVWKGEINPYGYASTFWIDPK